MFVFLISAIVIAVAPNALGQVCSRGSVANGCPNLNGNGFYIPSTKTCVGLVKTAAACASNTFLTPSDLAAGGAYANLNLCADLLASPFAYNAAGSTFTLNAQWNAGTATWQDIVTAKDLNPQPLTPACATDKFYYTISKYTRAGGIGGATATCQAAISLLLCVSAPVASPVIDSTWTPWCDYSGCTAAKCTDAGGTQTRTRWCLPSAPANGGLGATANCVKSTGTLVTVNGVLTETVTSVLGDCTPTCRAAVCMGGTVIGTGTVANSIDVTVPGNGGQVCTSKLPALPVTMVNPALFFDKGKSTLWACGRVPANWQIECYTLDTSKLSASWVPGAASVIDHPYQNFVFDSTGTLLACPPLEPGFSPQQTFDTTSGKWATTFNLPPSPYRTYGQPGCVIAGDYLYMFGGRQPTSSGAVYAQRLQLTPTVGAAWELLLNNLPQGITDPVCAISPTSKCQIFCASSNNQNGNVYTYDIMQNTFTGSTIGAVPNTEGADFLQVCGADQNLYAVGGTGASAGNLYTPAAAVTTTNSLLTTPGKWSTITGLPSVGRSFGSCISMAVGDLAIYGLNAGCTGC